MYNIFLRLLLWCIFLGATPLWSMDKPARLRQLRGIDPTLVQATSKLLRTLPAEALVFLYCHAHNKPAGISGENEKLLKQKGILVATTSSAFSFARNDMRSMLLGLLVKMREGTKDLEGSITGKVPYIEVAVEEYVK